LELAYTLCSDPPNILPRKRRTKRVISQYAIRSIPENESRGAIFILADFIREKNNGEK
jgi:hypothetical protein